MRSHSRRCRPLSSSARWVGAAVAVWLLIAEQPLHAYIDPDSGSLIYQAILAGLLGLAFTLRRRIDTLWRFLRGRAGGDASSKGDADRT